jgi:hypothetical protein
MLAGIYGPGYFSDADDRKRQQSRIALADELVGKPPNTRLDLQAENIVSFSQYT